MTSLSDEAIDRLCAAANWPEFESNRYAVTQEIGRGGMGTVYAAIDEGLGREVAIKVSNAVASASFEHRLAAEARVLARLEHPGIVPVHDVGRLADGRLFYVMKRVDGTTLSAHLRQATDLSERLRIFERMCEAVAFAHARGILHRDLKPDNVMIGAFGEVMVMDWGVAKALVAGHSSPPPEDGAASGDTVSSAAPDAGTTAGTVLGTRGFMAPEQARGDLEHLDERTDVFALGVILLALITSNPAPLREGLSPLDLRAALPSIPGPLRSICARALNAEPAERYRSAAELGADVARYRAGQAVHAHRETVLEKVVRVATAYRTPILLVLAYMVMRALVALMTGR